MATEPVLTAYVTDPVNQFVCLSSYRYHAKDLQKRYRGKELTINNIIIVAVIAFCIIHVV
jgi:hypothetical protein